jgi:hypothetical protein
LFKKTSHNLFTKILKRLGILKTECELIFEPAISCSMLFLMVTLMPVSSQAQKGCTTKDCHQGILDIVPMKFEMMQLIKKNGQRHGDPDGCIICHGGNPNTSKKKKAHKSIPSTLKRAAGMGSDNLYQFDWTKVVAKDGVQLVTVGSHWPASRAFNKEELGKFLRTGTCMACHKNMDNTSFWEKVSTKETLDTIMHEKMLNDLLLNKK